MKSCYLIVYLAFIVCLSCEMNKNSREYLSIDDSKIFKYQVNDTLLFKCSETAYVDSYYISNILYRYDPENDISNISAIGIGYSKIFDNMRSPITGFIRYDTSLVDFSGNFPGAGIFYSDPSIEYTLEDTILEDVYVVWDIPTNDTSHFKVVSLYYSDIYGFIRYDMRDGRVYELLLE